MNYQDKSLQCSDCGQQFVFTAGEQEFYWRRGLQNEPRRCPTCRQAKKAGRYSDNDYRSTRRMFPAVCSECNKDTEVPFEPTGDRPVYCSDCFRKVRARR